MSYYVRYYLLLYVVNIDIDLTDVKRDDGKREYSIVTGCYFNQFSLITDTVFDIWRCFEGDQLWMNVMSDEV